MPAITKPNQHFDISLYTGNGSTQSITGLNFQPESTERFSECPHRPDRARDKWILYPKPVRHNQNNRGADS